MLIHAAQLHEIFVKVYLVLYNLLIGNVLFFNQNFNNVQMKSDRKQMKFIKKSFLR